MKIVLFVFCVMFFCVMLALGVLVSLEGVSPNTGSAGDKVTLKGFGFSDQPIVTFDEAKATVVSYTDTQIVVIVPSGSGSPRIKVRIRGKGASVRANAFKYK